MQVERIKICELGSKCTNNQCRNLHYNDPHFAYKVLMEKANNQQICLNNCANPNMCLNLHKNEILPILCEKKECDGSNCHFTHDHIYQESKATSKQHKQQQCVSFKELGTKHFQNGNYVDAIKAFDQAISCDNTMSVLYSNKGLCYKKLGDWENTNFFAMQALMYDKENLRAQFLRAISNSILSMNQKDPYLLHILNKSITELTEIEVDAMKKSNLSLQNLKKEKLKIYYLLDQLKQFQLEFTLMEVVMREKPNNYQDYINFLWGKILENQEKYEEQHHFLTCPISLEFFVEPVLVCSGQTYEREFLQQHIKKNGNYDPCSRTPIGKAITNIQLLQAVDSYKKYLQSQSWYMLSFE